MKRSSGAPGAPRVRVVGARPFGARPFGARPFGALVGITAFVGALAFAPRALAQGEPADLDPTIGYNYNEIETPRITGTAGAIRASSNSVHALFVNPANMAASRVYHIAAFAQIWPEAARQSYGAAAVDSVVSNANVAGGLGGTFNLQDQDGIDRRWTDLRFALAYPVSDQFFVGAAGRYMWLSEDGVGPLGDSVPSSGLPNHRIVKNMSFDAGVTLKPMPELALSVVGDNLTAPSHAYQPLSVGGGAAVMVGDFSVEGDVVGDFITWEETTVRTMGAVEALFADHVSARVGYRYDQGPDSHSLAAGVGYIERAFDIDASFRRVLIGETATVIAFGFTYHLDSTGMTPNPGETF